MFSRERLSLSFLTVLLFSSFTYSYSTSDLSIDPENPPPGYKEIPYYLKQLEETTLEEKRIEYDKLIHDAVVHANLLDKKVVKDMIPIIDRIQRAMDSGLDRSNLSGSTNWLSSAVDYFEREKLLPIVEIPESDWAKPQFQNSTSKMKLSTYPEKIILYEDKSNRVVAESTFIHEAVISPNGKKIAFFRTINEKATQSEIWVIDLKKGKKKKVADVQSCYTLLFSLDGDDIFFQEKPEGPLSESRIGRVSVGGGTPQAIGTGRLLETIVEKGRYKGSLIIFKKTIHHMGTAEQDCAFAYKVDGKRIGRLKDGPCR